MAKDDDLTLTDGRVNPIKLARMIKQDKQKEKKVVPGRVIQGTAITKRRSIADVPTVRGNVILKNYADN